MKTRIFGRQQGIKRRAPHPAERVSEFIGVHWNKNMQKWQSSIGHPEDRKKTVYIGSFDDEIEAALAYNEKALELYGPDARLN